MVFLLANKPSNDTVEWWLFVKIDLAAHLGEWQLNQDVLQTACQVISLQEKKNPKTNTVSLWRYNSSHRNTRSVPTFALIFAFKCKSCIFSKDFHAPWMCRLFKFTSTYIVALMLASFGDFSTEHLTVELFNYKWSHVRFSNSESVGKDFRLTFSRYLICPYFPNTLLQFWYQPIPI